VDAPRRIVVLDDDARVRELVQAALKAPEFEVHAFADGRDALMKLHDIAPELILSDVWMPDVDGRLFMQVVKRSPMLREVPFLFLTACDQKTIEAALEDGANGYLMKPFPISLLRQRVRSMLGMPVAGSARPLELPSPSAPAGLPPPPPVVVPHPSAAATVRFTPLRDEPAPVVPLHPEATLRVNALQEPTLLAPRPPAALSPPEPAPLRLEPAVEAPAEPRILAPLPRRSAERFVEPLDRHERLDRPERGPHPLPTEIEGCFTMALVAGRQVPVLTEAGNRPNFTITTCMTSGGRAIRKIETSWQHPLERREDVVSAQKEVRMQHEQALAALKQLDLSRLSRRVVWDSKRRLVDGDLLCWALTAVWREARGRLGNDLAHGLLRASFERLSRTIEGLRTFRITSDGRVVLNVRGGPLVPHMAAVAAAEWAVSFVTASRTSGETAVSAIRRATATRESRLERIGFTTAVAAVAERAQRRATELTGLATRPYHDH
jgi:CheY-like chemotaxis protein